MNDLDSKIAEEIDDEALFRLAEGEEREFSQEYQQNMNQLYRKATAHPKRKMKPVRRIIAIAAIIAMLTGAAAATFWEEIQQFFAVNFGHYSELWTSEAVSPSNFPLNLVPEDWGSFWCPKETFDYTMVCADTKANQKIVTFQNADGEFKFYQWSDRKYMTTDSDAGVVAGIYVGDQEVYAIERELEGAVYRTVFWTNENTSFELYGTLPFDEMCEIAESLVLIER